jgi:hypothetical protein
MEMEKKRGTVISKNDSKFFRFVDIAFSHEDDEIYFKEVPILGEILYPIEENGRYEMELVVNDGIVHAKPILMEYPHSSYFPELKIMDVNTGEIHRVWKFVVGGNGEINIWTNTWYGRHVIGMDCVFVKE